MNDVMKKRLIGAIVLVVIGVLLPLLLVRCLHGETADRSASMRVYEVSPDGQARRADGTQAQAGPNDAAKAQSRPASQAETRPQSSEWAQLRLAGPRPLDREGMSAPAGAAQRQASTTVSVAQAEEEPMMPQVVSPSAALESADSAPEPVTQSSGQASTPSASSSETSAASGAGPSLRKTASDGNGWVIQLASFGDEANAQRLATELNADYRAYYRASDVGGKTWYRVRIGPFDSSSQARTVAAGLRQQGRATLVQRAE